MKFYADLPALRLRQRVADFLVLVWIGAWIVIGRELFELVDRLRAAGDTTERAGLGMASRMTSIASRIDDVPAVGDALRRPFTGAASASRELASAGATASDTVHTLAIWLGLLVTVLPVLWLLVRWLPGRVLWVREATAATRLQIDADDLHLFALRAVTNRPLHELRRATPDPAGALARGDYAALAALELRDLGLNPRVS